MVESERTNAPAAAADDMPISDETDDEARDPLAEVEPSPSDEVNPADHVEQHLAVPIDEDDYR